MEKYNVKLLIEYDGTDYSGWQKQNDRETIQGLLEDRISTVLRDRIKIIGASRTDSGVHALGQVANFEVRKKLDLHDFKSKMNSYLPDQIAIRQAEYVEEDFNARFAAHSKLYRYTVILTKSPVRRLYSWYIFEKVAFEDLEDLALIFVGEHDFGGFAKKIKDKPNRVCRIISSRWLVDNGAFIYEVEGNRFLHGLVRGLVGAMVESASGKLSTATLKNALKDGHRNFNIKMAPARGLSLVRVNY